LLEGDQFSGLTPCYGMGDSFSSIIPTLGMINYIASFDSFYE
jgi:hypothetical protein